MVYVINALSGSFGRWHHLSCWRVPMKIWLGLPSPKNFPDHVHLFEKALLGMNEVLLTGYSHLAPHDKTKVAKHVMNEDNWARATTRETKSPVALTEKVKKSGDVSVTNAAPEAALIEVHQHPSKNALSGKTFVLTGRFPEIGGGYGLNEGKDRAKELIESLGGVVRSKVSGKTGILIVGQEPGFRKVYEARMRNIPLLGLDDLVIEGAVGGKLAELEAEAISCPMEIEEYSPGFANRQLWREVPAEQYAIASGSEAPQNVTISPTRSKKQKKKRKLEAIAANF